MCIHAIPLEIFGTSRSQKLLPSQKQPRHPDHEIIKFLLQPHIFALQLWPWINSNLGWRLHHGYIHHGNIIYNVLICSIHHGFALCLHHVTLVTTQARDAMMRLMLLTAFVTPAPRYPEIWWGTLSVTMSQCQTSILCSGCHHLGAPKPLHGCLQPQKTSKRI